MKILAIATFSILLSGSGFASALRATLAQDSTGMVSFDSGATVPEPTTLALLGAGLFSLAATRRRTKV